MKNQSSCCGQQFGVRELGGYGIQYCSGCGQPIEDLNRPMFAKMQLVHPGLYEQALGVVYGMIQEQSPPPPKSEKKPMVLDYVDVDTPMTSPNSFSGNYTWVIKKNR